MTTPHEFIAANRERFLEQLKDFLRIPSVSADRTNHTQDVARAANWLADDMRAVGLENVEQFKLEGHHPIVYGEWLYAGADAPTVLIYGHYDVQPAAMEDGWDTPPFEPIIKDGMIFARGASDDKGQMFAQLKAVEALIQSGECPVNIKFLAEGEEEISSGGLEKFVPANTDKLKADVCVISDTAIMDEYEPSIVYSLRGITYFELEMWGPTDDLHSGSYGGAVHNPVQALTQILGSLHDADGRVTVPGFYDDVLELSADEREKLKEVALTEDALKAATGTPQAWGDPNYTITERLGARPTLEIHGIGGGFYGEGAKTVLPSRVLAKISCRLVANQDPVKIYDLVKNHILSLVPPTVRAEIRPVGSNGYPALVDINDPALKAAVVAYERGWGKPPKYVRGGGSIPIVADFQNHLQIPVILLGFGLNSNGIHGPNEHFHLHMYEKGVDTATHFLQAVGEMVSSN
jgi:acetylornithine deacetylase/succinyl-diaminopimelate desuccinylase-like protein